MIIMNLEPIKGDCQIKGFTDWITLDDCSVEIAREPKESSKTGTQDLQLGMPECGAVSIKKAADKASVYLQKMAIGGGAIGKDCKCRIVWLESGLGKADTANFDQYMEMELTRPVIKSYSLESSGDERPMESIELIYAKIKMSYFERHPDDGKTTKHGPHGWDLVTGTPISG